MKEALHTQDNVPSPESLKKDTDMDRASTRDVSKELIFFEARAQLTLTFESKIDTWTAQFHSHPYSGRKGRNHVLEKTIICQNP